MRLKSKLVFRFSMGLIFVAAILFVPAGSLRFWQGWVSMAVTLIPVAFCFAYFYRHDPQLIERRLETKEIVLRQELPGYSEYCLRTRFRLVPLVW